MEPNDWLIVGGLVIGVVFGVLAQRFRLCMVAGAGNWLLVRDGRQVIAFLAAWIIAIAGTQILELVGIVDIASSSYRNSLLDWFGASVGGLLFGVGAALAGSCSIRTVVRTMEGSMHALLVFIMFALAAAVTQFGFLETARISLTNITASDLTTDAGLASILSIPSWLVFIVIEIALIAFLWRVWKNSANVPMLIIGIVIGGLVISSWYVTGVLAQDEFDPVNPSAITMSGPFARFGYILISGRIPALSFAISFVIGTALFSFLSALVTGQFSITAPRKGMAKMALIGGSLMGIGGIMAYGCNIGQGLSGISTLSVESLLAVIGMVLGVGIVTKWMEKHA